MASEAPAGVVSKVLSSAVRVWLRSQVESVEDLQFQIGGSNRQILTGHIPKVAIAARQAVYQGLHLSQVDVVGEAIRINLGQVLKGKPLQLLDIVPIQGDIELTQADLNASLSSPLLRGGITDFFRAWRATWNQTPAAELAEGLQEPLELRKASVVILPEGVTLNLDWQSAGAPISMVLVTRLDWVASGLKLEHPEVWVNSQTEAIALADYELELGDVALQGLQIEAGLMKAQVCIQVRP
jgi:hypothetical protein